MNEIIKTLEILEKQLDKLHDKDTELTYLEIEEAIKLVKEIQLIID